MQKGSGRRRSGQREIRAQQRDCLCRARMQRLPRLRIQGPNRDFRVSSDDERDQRCRLPAAPGGRDSSDFRPADAVRGRIEKSSRRRDDAGRAAARDITLTLTGVLPDFWYKALTSTGEVQQGWITAPDERDVEERLRSGGSYL